MSAIYPVVVIGAGPYGLSTAAHLRGQGVEPYVIGQPMEFWKSQMPAGMLLRSPFEASNISDPHGKLTFSAYARAMKTHVAEPVPIGDFIAYGEWFQRHVAPDLDHRRVGAVSRDGDGFRIDVEGGDTILAGSVVLALGIGQFAYRPEQFARTPEALSPHSSQLSDLTSFRGQRVIVIGSGQSGLESAALLREQGADVQIVVRASAVELMTPGWRMQVFRALTPGPLRPFSYMVRPPTGLGTIRTSRTMAIPEKFRKQPVAVQESLLADATKPRGAHWLRPRLAGVPIKTGVEVRDVQVIDGGLRLSLSDGSQEHVQRVVLATGFHIDVTRYGMLDASLHASIRTRGGYPELTTGLETSVPGLYMTGVVGERTLGPTLRFVTGTSNAGPRLASAIAARLGASMVSVPRR